MKHLYAITIVTVIIFSTHTWAAPAGNASATSLTATIADASVEDYSRSYAGTNYVWTIRTDITFAATNSPVVFDPHSLPYSFELSLNGDEFKSIPTSIRSRAFYTGATVLVSGTNTHTLRYWHFLRQAKVLVASNRLESVKIRLTYKGWENGIKTPEQSTNVWKGALVTDTYYFGSTHKVLDASVGGRHSVSTIVRQEETDEEEKTRRGGNCL